MAAQQFANLFTGNSAARIPDKAVAVEEREGKFAVVDFYTRLIRSSFETEQEAERHALNLLFGDKFEQTFKRDQWGNYIAQPGWNGLGGRNGGR